MIYSLLIVAGLAYCALSQDPFAVRETTLFEYASFDESFGWVEAEARCNEWHGHLVSIHNDNENALVKEMILELPIPPIGYRFTWIGGRQFNQNEVTEWSDGTPFDYIYKGSLCYVSSNHDCLLYDDIDDCWGDWQCEGLSQFDLDFHQAGFICKRSKRCCTAYDDFAQYDSVCESLPNKNRCDREGGPCHWGPCPRDGCCEYVRGRNVWRTNCPTYTNEYACGYRRGSRFCQWKDDCGGA